MNNSRGFFILTGMETDLPEEETVDPSLVRRLHTVYGLDAAVAERIIEDVLLFYADTQEEWIRSRHIRLQGQGLANEAIFSRIAQEVGQRRFAAKPLSLRQIRRVIYG